MNVYKLQSRTVHFVFVHSHDGSCYFESKPSIISKIIAVGMEPKMDLPRDAIEVVFDHVFVSQNQLALEY